MRLIYLIYIFIGFSFFGFSQQKDSVFYASHIPTVEITGHQKSGSYKLLLRRVKRVYPYVLEAKKLLEEYDKETKSLNKKYKIRKFGRKQNKSLNDEFTYAFKSMYRKDGVVMMKLIHISTKNTTYEIIEKYRGKAHANLVYGAGKLFDQDFKVKMDPNKDRVLASIYRDIQLGKIRVPTTINKISKEEYKAKEKEKTKARKERKKKRKAKEKIGKSLKRTQKKANND